MPSTARTTGRHAATPAPHRTAAAALRAVVRAPAGRHRDRAAADLERRLAFVDYSLADLLAESGTPEASR